MQNWYYIVALLALIAIVRNLITAAGLKKRLHEDTPADLSDAQPTRYEPTMETKTSEEQGLFLPNQSIIGNAEQDAQAEQDKLNQTLWHKLTLLIPNTQWIHTQHQSLTEIRWLCLGPDYHHFVADAKLKDGVWIWTFLKA